MAIKCKRKDISGNCVSTDYSIEYIYSSKCINTIVKDKAKGNINEAAVQTANFLVGEIIENTSILTQYMIYMENSHSRTFLYP